MNSNELQTRARTLEPAQKALESEQVKRPAVLNLFKLNATRCSFCLLYAVSFCLAYKLKHLRRVCYLDETNEIKWIRHQT